MKNIICICNDLLFKTKIAGLLNPLGVVVKYYDHFENITFDDLQIEDYFFIIDLENERLNLSIISTIKRKFKEKIFLLGYCSHVKSDLMSSARTSGFDEVMPRSKFVKTLPHIVNNFVKAEK